MQNAVNVYKMLRTTHNEYFTTSNSGSDASTHQRNPIDSYIEAQAHPLSKKKTDTRALPHCTRLVPQLHQMRVHIVKRSLPLHSPPPPPKNHHSFMYTSKKNMHSDIKYDIYEMTNDVQFWL